MIKNNNPIQTRFTLRFASENDAKALLGIYAQYIQTNATFECALPTVCEFEKRINETGRDYPYIIAEKNSIVVGYAYAHRFKERAAYAWDAELSVYTDKNHTSQGIGTMLYEALLDILERQNIKNAYGLVVVPNEKSEALHKALGFTEDGMFKNAGYKNGSWHTVKIFHKQTGALNGKPEPFIPISELKDSICLNRETE